MAIFGCILTDDCVQVDDRFRIWADKNSVTPDEDVISMVEVSPDGGITWYDVSDDLYLDWQYPSEGTYEIQTRVTAGANSETFTKEITVKTEEEDCLFAGDEDLRGLEPMIYDCLECYRCSYKYIHRQVKKCLMDCLLREGLLWDGCEAIDLMRLKTSHQLRKLATYWALELIFMSFSKSNDDFYYDRAKHYRKLRSEAYSSYRVYFDKDGDGTVESNEYLIRSNRLIRR